MTLQESIDEVRRIGSIRVENGKLKLRFPEADGPRLKPAIAVLRQNRDAALLVLTTTDARAVPPPECWPESLLGLAQQRGRQSGDPEAAKAEVWISYTEFLAERLNKLFDEHGKHGPHCQQNRAPDEQCQERYHRSRLAANIKPETIQDGIDKEMRRGEKAR
jgi:hypothetical protein